MWSLHLHVNNKWVHLLYNNKSGPERRQCHLCITESSIFIANCLNRHILRLSAECWTLLMSMSCYNLIKLKTLWHCTYFNLISLSFIRDMLTKTFFLYLQKPVSWIQVVCEIHMACPWKKTQKMFASKSCYESKGRISFRKVLKIQIYAL